MGECETDEGEEISLLPVSVSDGFLLESLGKCMLISVYSLFFFFYMVCMRVNTCVLRYYGDAGSLRGACRSDLNESKEAAGCWAGLVQVSEREGKKD